MITEFLRHETNNSGPHEIPSLKFEGDPADVRPPEAKEILGRKGVVLGSRDRVGGRAALE